MANAAVDLSTIDKLKARLGLGQVVLSADDESDLARLLTEVSQRFHSEAGAPLLLAPRVDTFDGNDKTRHWLEHGTPPSAEDAWTASVTTVVVDGVTIPELTGPATAGWSLTGGSKLSLTGYVFSEGTDNCVVSYQAGFSTDPIWDVPQDIEGAVIELAALRWKEKDRIGQVSKSVSGETVDFRGSNVWSTFMAVAAMYRRPRL